jgi:DNA-binding NarL/FixJ family response regulator
MLTSTPRLRAPNGKTWAGTTLLIAPEEHHGTIANVLSAEGWETIALEGIEDLDESFTDAEIAVAWVVEDSSHSLARTLKPLAQRLHGTPLVAVCGKIERWGVRAALGSGVAGVVLHEELETSFGPCLQAVLTGQTCVPRAYGRQIEPPALSAREKQILGLVVMGYMNSQIAERLFLAESTVKSHLSSAFSKLGVRSRNEAVNLIVDPDSGLGLGILGLGGEPMGPTVTAEVGA